jgi:cell division septum initiation protein DivIVA
VNTTFEVMDLIGDYWTDIIEQVVPATTIWDGHNNSGKVYRNTIFEQQKYPYRRYATNYFDGNECSIDGITQSAFAYTTDYVGLSLIEYCQKGECLGEEVIGCNNELKTLQQRKLFLESEISRITGILNKEAGIVANNNTTPTTPTLVGDTTTDFDVSSRPIIGDAGDVDRSASPTNPANIAASNEESACEYTQEEIDDLKGQKDGYQSELDILNGDENTEGSIAQKQSECDTIAKEVTDKNDEIAGNISTECEPITAQITEAEEKLTMLTEGTLSYQRQKDWVNILKNRYQNCVKCIW